MPKPGPTRVLYMEDDAGMARLLQKRLEQRGYSVDIARDGEEGLAMYDAGHYDVLAMDQNMPVRDGLGVLRALAARGPLPPIIMVTGTGNEEIAVQAMKLGAGDYIVKDVDGGYLELLPSVIEQVLSQHRLAEEKQRADEALRQYAAELEARNEELDAFAHTVAHDLKGPLSNIMGHAQALIEFFPTLSDKEQLRSLHFIAQGGRKMSNIIDELLLLSTVRKMNIESQLLDMASIVAGALQRMGDAVQSSRADVIAPSTWPVAWGYAAWVEEVWVNYISNALRYGNTPLATLRIELGASFSPGLSSPADNEREAPRDMVRFWVSDNGPGISPEDQTRLFTPFTQLSQVRARGYGLGLSIVRRIVDRLGGQVGVESEVGRGSLFFFTLPAQPLAATGPADT